MNQPNELYGTHLPILTRIMDITSGPVLELGMGIYSTPLLHTLCALQKRLLISYDNDTKWMGENQKWNSNNHVVHFIEDWSTLDWEFTHWSVVLVDHKPASRRRIEISNLRLQANFIVIHDSEPEQDKFFKYSWIYKHFKYRYDYTKLMPWTTVLSNYVDLSFLSLDSK